MLQVAEAEADPTVPESPCPVQALQHVVAEAEQLHPICMLINKLLEARAQCPRQVVLRYVDAQTLAIQCRGIQHHGVSEAEEAEALVQMDQQQ
jgi:hypothetical protein